MNLLTLTRLGPAGLPLGYLVPGVLAATALSGCCSTCGQRGMPRDPCATIPQGAIPQPTGHHARAFQEIQTTKAEMDDFVIYKNEWCLNGTTLGPYGGYHLRQIVKRLPEAPPNFPVIVQIDASDSQVNEARRQLVVAQLTQAGVADAEARVIVGYPEAEGLYALEAERIVDGAITGSSDRDQTGANFGRNLYPGGGGSRGGLGNLSGTRVFGRPFGGISVIGGP